MAVAVAWKKHNVVGKYRQILMKVTYGNGDTSVAVNTGLKLILAYSHSEASVNTKVITGAAVSGGTITFTVTDPLAAAYIYVDAIGL